MKRMMMLVVAFGLFSSLVLVAFPSHGSGLGIVTKAHAQDQDNGNPRGCTNSSLNGTYGFYRHGTSGVGTAAANALAAVGIITLADGTVVAGHQTTSKNGVFTDTVFGNLTYSVDPDCTGSLFLANGTLAGHFSIVDGGKEVFLLSMAPTNAVIEVWKRVGTPQDEQ